MQDYKLRKESDSYDMMVSRELEPREGSETKEEVKRIYMDMLEKEGKVLMMNQDPNFTMMLKQKVFDQIYIDHNYKLF